MTTHELVANILGVAGGLVLAVCLLPQVHQAISTRSVGDINYGWLFIYLFGLLLNLVYFVMIDAVVAWATLLIEIAFCVLMIFLKFYYGKRQRSELHVEELSKTSRTRDLRFSRRFTMWATPANADAILRNAPHGDSDRYRGHHFLFDYTFTNATSARTLGTNVMALMKKICEKNNVRYVHERMVIFDESDETTPPGFTSCLLIDESHITAHCYSDIGLLALDVFTCGSKPEQTHRVARQLHEGILSMSDCLSDLDGYYRESPRFPKLSLPHMDTSMNSTELHEGITERNRNPIEPDKGIMEVEMDLIEPGRVLIADP